MSKFHEILRVFRKPPARANGHTHECVSSELDSQAYHQPFMDG